MIDLGRQPLWHASEQVCQGPRCIEQLCICLAAGVRDVPAVRTRSHRPYRRPFAGVHKAGSRQQASELSRSRHRGLERCRCMLLWLEDCLLTAISLISSPSLETQRTSKFSSPPDSLPHLTFIHSFSDKSYIAWRQLGSMSAWLLDVVLLACCHPSVQGPLSLRRCSQLHRELRPLRQVLTSKAGRSAVCLASIKPDDRVMQMTGACG